MHLNQYLKFLFGTFIFLIIHIQASAEPLDFNGDGKDDIIWRSNTGENHIWYMQSNGSHKWMPKISKPIGFKIVGRGDFNGDGISDIFWRNGTKNSLWLMNADGSHTWKPKVAKPIEYEVAGIGDFNGDSISDIFWRRGNNNSLWLMNSNGSHKWIPLVSKPICYEIAGVGDFNGDGISDIFWRNDNDNSLWLMNDDGSYKWIQQAAKSVYYSIIGIGDFDDNGMDDILWRKDNTNYLWLMDNRNTHKYIQITSKYINFYPKLNLIRDRLPPDITILGNNPLNIKVGNIYKELGAAAIDNRDGDITYSIISSTHNIDTSVVGNYSIIYSISDFAGNISYQTRKVNIYDKTIESAYKYNRISIAGSSITWGSGFLGEKAYVGEVEKYLRENVADTIGAEELPNPNEIINEKMSYKGKLYRYNKNSLIRGTITGDKIYIMFASSNIDTIVEMIVDGKSLGQYIIQGNTNIKPVKRYPDVGRKSFRQTNENAVHSWTMGNNPQESHSFSLKVIKGSLLLNFITNHMYYFQNAGIGMYSANSFLTDKDTKTTTKEIRDFNPDLFILESGTNDANLLWYVENKGVYTTNDWNPDARNFTNFTLVSSNQIKLPNKVQVKKGDVVTMGKYNGDIRTLAVGIVKNDSHSKIVTLTTEVPTNIVKKCKIKRIKRWEDNVEKIVEEVTDGKTNIDIGIATSGVPNYYDPYIYTQYQAFSREIMGYREKGELLAEKNGWMFFDFFGKTLNYNPYIDDGSIKDKWSSGDNTHPRTIGYKLFGSAIIDVLELNQ